MLLDNYANWLLEITYYYIFIAMYCAMNLLKRLDVDYKWTFIVVMK